MCVCEYLESSQEGSEDVDLDGLLPGALGLPHTLPKVGQQLLPVLVCHRGERPAEEDNGGVDDGHTQWEGPREGRTLQRSTSGITSLYLHYQQGYLVLRQPCLVPRPQCLVPRSPCLIPRPQCLIPRPQCLIPRPQCLIPRPPHPDT